MTSAISVIIPAFNRSATIEYCLRSVFAQTLQPLEILVVDDGSKDDTVSVVAAMKHPLVRIVQQPVNSGAQAARNRGISEARGEWIAFHDSDDEWLPEKLEKQWQEAIRMDVDVSYCNAFVQVDGEKYVYPMIDHSSDTFRSLLKHYGPMFPGLMVRKKCFEIVGLLDPDVPSFQEWDTSLMLARHYSFCYIPLPLFVYHLHSGETISKDVKREADGFAYIVRKYKKEIVREVGWHQYRQHCHDIVFRYAKSKNKREMTRWMKEFVMCQPSGWKKWVEWILLGFNATLFEVYLEQQASFFKFLRFVTVKTKIYLIKKFRR